MASIPMEAVSTPCDEADVQLVRSRYADGRPPVIVIRARTTNENRSSATQIVIADWKAAENLAYEILEEVAKWPSE